MKKIKGGVTAAKGYEAAATAAGIKYKDRTDMAMIYSKVPCAAAGTFTTNVVKAAPVKWDQQVVASGAGVQAVIVIPALQMHVPGQKALVTVKIRQKRQQKCSGYRKTECFSDLQE